MPKSKAALNQDNLSSALAAFHLSGTELAVYQAALELGLRPASKIAKHAGLNRPYTYDVLSALVEKGLVTQSKRNSIKQFSCTPPEELIDLVHRREAELSRQREQLVQALPMLKQLRQAAGAQPGFRVLRGVDGLKLIFEAALAQPENIIYAFVNVPCCGLLLETECAQFSKVLARRLEDLKIEYRGITSSQPVSKGKSETAPTLAIRRFGGSLELPLEAFVFGSSVAFLPGGVERVGFVIENDAMAHAAKAVHEMLWNLLGGAL